jgi:hypothetical protein
MTSKNYFKKITSKNYFKELLNAAALEEMAPGDGSSAAAMPLSTDSRKALPGLKWGTRFSGI